MGINALPYIPTLSQTQLRAAPIRRRKSAVKDYCANTLLQIRE